MWPFVLSVPAFFGLGSWADQQYVCAVLGAVAVGTVGLLGRRVGGDRVGVLVILALLAAYRVIDRPVPRSAALLGFLIGLASLTRGEGLFYVVFLTVPVCIVAQRPSPASRTTRYT